MKSFSQWLTESFRKAVDHPFSHVPSDFGYKFEKSKHSAASKTGEGGSSTYHSFSHKDGSKLDIFTDRIPKKGGGHELMHGFYHYPAKEGASVGRGNSAEALRDHLEKTHPKSDSDFLKGVGIKEHCGAPVDQLLHKYGFHEMDGVWHHPKGHQLKVEPNTDPEALHGHIQKLLGD